MSYTDKPGCSVKYSSFVAKQIVQMCVSFPFSVHYGRLFLSCGSNLNKGGLNCSHQVDLCVSQLLDTYIMTSRELSLNTAACRLLQNIMPGLETSAVFQEKVKLHKINYRQKWQVDFDVHSWRNYVVRLSVCLSVCVFVCGCCILYP